MLIPLEVLAQHFKLHLRGVLHIGAHECEEQEVYLRHNVDNGNIYWIEAMEDKVKLMKEKNKNLNIYQAVIDVEDDKEISFNVADNGQSSSILEFGTHAVHHPYVKMIGKKQLKTTRVDTFIKNNKIPIEKLNFLNLDIQGKELDALKSMGDYIQYVQYIYTEVNSEKVYKDCALLPEIDEFLKEKGFIRVACKMWGNCGWGDAFYIRQ
jgi:FkbM family methyltransferase